MDKQMVITGDPAAIIGVDELVARARAGDAQAFCQIAAQHQSRLLRQAAGLTRDLHSAEDLVSETLVEAWRSLSRFNHTCRFSTWLFSILLHRHQKSLRRARSRPVSATALTPSESARARDIQEKVASENPSPLEIVLQQEVADELRDAIDALSFKHRQVVLLRFFEGASLPEMAALLECSAGTVKSRLHYALEQLRKSPAAMNLFNQGRDTLL